MEAGEAKQLVKQAEKLTRKGKLEEAEKTLRDIVKSNPKDSRAKLSLGYVMLKQRRLIEAYDISSEVARAEPKNSYAFAVLGTTLLNAGNFRDAKSLFYQCPKTQQPGSLSLVGTGTARILRKSHCARSRIFTRSGLFRAARADFTYALAQVAARAERYIEAAGAYKRFLQISPQTDFERRDRIKGLIIFYNFWATVVRFTIWTAPNKPLCRLNL
jgi:tetratricopeptide (TPR) repeat protein